VARFLQRSARNLRTPVGSGYTVQFEFDPNDVREVIAAMQKWPEGIRHQIVRKGLAKWGKGVVRTATRHAYARAHRTKRHIIQVTRKYKSGVIWSAIGVATGAAKPGQSVEGRYGDQLPGWRSHFYEVGWTPYKARSGDEALRKGKGRGWRKKMRKRLTGQPRRYQTQFMAKAYAYNVSRLNPAIEDALADWVRRVNGNGRRRG
jgi:hypothetical protein